MGGFKETQKFVDSSGENMNTTMFTLLTISVSALVHTDGQQRAGRGQELDSATRAWPEAWLHAGVLQLDSSTASAVSAVSRLLPACCCSSENDSSSCLL